MAQTILTIKEASDTRGFIIKVFGRKKNIKKRKVAGRHLYRMKGLFNI